MSCTSKLTLQFGIAIIGQLLGQARVEIVYERFVWVKNQTIDFNIKLSVGTKFKHCEYEKKILAH
jgi:hypothetical protein